MEGLTIEVNEGTGNQADVELAKEWIDRALRKIHRKMVGLFGIRFEYFANVEIVEQPDIVRRLTMRIRNNLKETGVSYSDVQWQQISENLSRSPFPGFFENLAYYSPEDDVLYLSKSLVKEHLERVVPVCTHELAEKLLHVYLPSASRTPTAAIAEVLDEAEKANSPVPSLESLGISRNLIFKSILKEGFCEAIALQTLRHMDSEVETGALEEELRSGHFKCIDALVDLDRKWGNTNDTGEYPAENDGGIRRTQVMSKEGFAEEVLKRFQALKVTSYYLGYPLAKAILEKYGIKGARLALEEFPPNKAQYFANPQSYLGILEESTSTA